MKQLNFLLGTLGIFSLYDIMFSAKLQTTTIIIFTSLSVILSLKGVGFGIFHQLIGGGNKNENCNK